MVWFSKKSRGVCFHYFKATQLSTATWHRHRHSDLSLYLQQWLHQWGTQSPLPVVRFCLINMAKCVPNTPKLLFFPPENLKQNYGKCSQLLRNAELIGKVLLSARGSQRADIQISRTIFRQLLFITEFSFCSTHNYPPFCLGFFKKHSPCPWYFVLHVDVEVLLVRGSRCGRDEKGKL